MCRDSNLATVVNQLAGSDLLVVLGLEDYRCCRVSAVVSECLSSVSGSNAKILQLGLGERVGKLAEN